MNFEDNLIFLIKPFFIHRQKVEAKTQYLENEKSFEDEIKNIFHRF